MALGAPNAGGVAESGVWDDAFSPPPPPLLHFPKMKFWLFCVRRQCGLVQCVSAPARLTLGPYQSLWGIEQHPWPPPTQSQEHPASRQPDVAPDNGGEDQLHLRTAGLEVRMRVLSPKDNGLPSPSSWGDFDQAL